MSIFGLTSKNNISKNIIQKMICSIGKIDEIDVSYSENAVIGAMKNKIHKGREMAISTYTESNTRAAFSGEMLNRREILEYLNKSNCTIKPIASDADIFLCLFNSIGSSAVTKINGFFCAAVQDIKNSRMHLFVDRTGGIKSLYYLVFPDGFAFSSNLPCLLNLPWFQRKIDSFSMYSFFTTGYVLPPYTMIEGINKAGPGEEIIFNGNEVTRKVIERLDFAENNNTCNGSEELMNLLTKSIKDITSDNVKRAYLLSGGIDSSTIVAISSKVEENKLQTYSASFPGTMFDESIYAKSLADFCSCDNKCINLNRNELIEDLPKIVWYLDEPTLDFSIIPTYHLFKAVKKDAPVVISGDGPDHLFGRYYPLSAKLFIARFLRIFSPLAKLPKMSFLDKINRVSHASLFEAYKELFIIPSWGIENTGRIANIFTHDFRDKKRVSQSYIDIEISKKDSYKDIFNKLSVIDYYIDGSFGVFAKVGKMAIANDLVIREPFLDRRVADFIMNLPVKKKVCGNLFQQLLSKAKSKYLLKYKLGPEILPENIINKPKGGFTPPLSNWLKQTICQLPAEKILNSFIIDENYFKMSFLNEIIHQHKTGIRDWTTIIFMLITFDIWVRIFIESQDIAPPRWKFSDVYTFQKN